MPGTAATRRPCSSLTWLRAAATVNYERIDARTAGAAAVGGARVPRREDSNTEVWMATQASPSQAATERLALLTWPLFRGGIARATLAAAVLVCVALSAALLVASGRPTLSPGVSGQGAASRLAGEAGAMAALSMALGARDHAYHALAAPGGYEVANPAQHLHARFDRSGVSLSSGALRLSLHLRASGYAG